MNKSEREINRLAEKYGFYPGELTKNGSFRFKHKRNGSIVHHGSVIGNGRAMDNLEHEFKRAAAQ